MNQLFYRITATDGAYEVRDFLKPSNLPFPSPIGTEITIVGPEEDEFTIFAKVAEFKHEFRHGSHAELGFMYMLLEVDSLSELWDQESGSYISAPDIEKFTENLCKMGWEVIP